MKKLTILSKENVFGGYIQSGIAELVDCLAVSLSDFYQVSIVCFGHEHSLAGKFNQFTKSSLTKKTRALKVDYYFVGLGQWDKSFEIVEQIKPDILHIMSAPKDIEKLFSRPERVIFTFSNPKILIDCESSLEKYDAISAISNTWLEEALQLPRIGEILKKKGAMNIDNALLTEVFSPEKGFLLPHSYSATNLQGKEICKKKLQTIYGIPQDKIIFVTGSLRMGVSMKKIIELLPTIKAVNGFLLIATRTTAEEENYLKKLTQKDCALYLGSMINLVRLPVLLSGADFYIQPNNTTQGSFVAMAASQYGTVPIVSLDNPELLDKFNNSNAIIIENEDYESAIYSTIASPMRLMRGPDRKIMGMTTTCSWKEQKQLYIDLYNK